VPSATASAAPSIVESITTGPPATSTSAAAPAPTLPSYPLPIVKHSGNQVSGYYLDTTGFRNVAVLAIYSFNTDTPEAGKTSAILILSNFSDHLGAEFQQVVQHFLARATADKKTKLIIDLQANGGGDIKLGTDTFAQLFPRIKIVSQTNARATDALDVIGEVNSEDIAQTDPSNTTALGNLTLNFFTNVQTDLTPSFAAFSSWAALFGPVHTYGDTFTNLFQQNISDLTVTSGTGIVQSGTGNRTDTPRLDLVPRT